MPLDSRCRSQRNALGFAYNRSVSSGVWQVALVMLVDCTAPSAPQQGITAPAVDAATTVQPPTTPPAPDQTECNALTANAIGAVRSALAQSNNRCSRKEDCVSYDSSNDCRIACGGVLSVSTAELLATTLQQVNGTYCADFVKKGCRRGPAPPCPAISGLPNCIGGECVSERMLADQPDAGSDDAGR